MRVDETFAFTSDAAVNLHHLLYAAAWSIESAETGRPSNAQPIKLGDLSLRHASGFDEAIAYYRTELIGRHLLFDDVLQSLSSRLVGRGGSAPAGWETVFSPLLAEYVGTDWAEHDRHNNRWWNAISADLARLLPEAVDRLEQAYGRRLPDPPVLVSTVYVGDRLPGYTSLRPTHITCSTTHPESEGLTAVEIVLHEASHALIGGLRETIRDKVDVARPGLGQLWHAVLFYITGQVVVRLLADRGVAYTPYLESTGLFDRAWPHLRQPVTGACIGYLGGRWDWDSACDRLATALNT